jgi:hypothetical protein
MATVFVFDPSATETTIVTEPIGASSISPASYAAYVADSAKNMYFDNGTQAGTSGSSGPAESWA